MCLFCMHLLYAFKNIVLKSYVYSKSTNINSRTGNISISVMCKIKEVIEAQHSMIPFLPEFLFQVNWLTISGFINPSNLCKEPSKLIVINSDNVAHQGE